MVTCYTDVPPGPSRKPYFQISLLDAAEMTSRGTVGVWAVAGQRWALQPQFTGLCRAGPSGGQPPPACNFDFCVGVCLAMASTPENPMGASCARTGSEGLARCGDLATTTAPATARVDRICWRWPGTWTLMGTGAENGWRGASRLGGMNPSKFRKARFLAFWP